MKIINKEIRSTDIGKITLDKQQLEKTIRDLTWEIEDLSIRNNDLYEDLKTKSFFDKYNETLQELNKLKEKYEGLIDMKFIELENFKIKNRSNYSYSLSTNLVHDFMTHHANDDHNSNQAKYSLM